MAETVRRLVKIESGKPPEPIVKVAAEPQLVRAVDEVARLVEKMTPQAPVFIQGSRVEFFDIERDDLGRMTRVIPVYED